MAFASLLQTATIRDALKNAIALNIGGSSPDTLKIALFTNTCTPAQDTDPATYPSAPYNANEVTGTGWTAAQALAAPAMTLVAGTGVKMTGTNVSASGTTLSAVRGCIIYDDTISPKCVIVAITFGADYTTSNGTFGVTWDANGIFLLTLH